MVIMNTESKAIDKSLEKSESLEDITDEQLVQLYNDASNVENQLFKMLFDTRAKKNKYLGEMVRRTKKNGKNGSSS